MADTSTYESVKLMHDTKLGLRGGEQNSVILPTPEKKNLNFYDTRIDAEETLMI